MKKGILIISFLFILNKFYSQPISYVFSSIAGTYTALAAPTAIPEIYWGADNELSGNYNIGFFFQFGCNFYTQFRVSADGWLTFNLGGSVSFADAINDLSGYAGMRPGIAPLWDDLAWNNNNPPQCGYQLLGAFPNRILVVQWIRANWKILGTAPGEMSFQVRLYEGTNRIEMVYHQETGTMNAPSASIGLAGSAIGDYYSVNAALTAASKVTNVQNIATKPAEGQIFRWDPPCNTLPIELISFTGENTNGKNNLKWSTATEKNNDHFSLERSTDAVSFTEIAKIKGAGNSNKQKDYDFTDDKVQSEITYYRLKQVDLDNTFAYSPMIVLNNSTKNTNLTIFPNPVSTQLNLRGLDVKNYSLSDVSGKILKEGNVSNNSIDVSELDDGLYFLKLDDNLPRKILVHDGN